MIIAAIFIAGAVFGGLCTALGIYAWAVYMPDDLWMFDEQSPDRHSHHRRDWRGDSRGGFLRGLAHCEGHGATKLSDQVPELVERVARAMEPSAFATFDKGYSATAEEIEAIETLASTLVARDNYRTRRVEILRQNQGRWTLQFVLGLLIAMK